MGYFVTETIRSNLAFDEHLALEVIVFLNGYLI